MQPCLDCGKLSRLGNRCEEHRRIKNRKEDERKALRKKLTGQYSGDYKKRAKLIRDNAVVCHICKLTYIPGDPWEADHLIPGDRNSPLAAAHRSCNIKRGNSPL
jgi:hypothetical protein